jgi:hypothetical protein
MIDLEREQPVTLDKAPGLIPAINAVPGMEARKRLCSRTLYNWATRGRRGVVLETVPIGGVLVTTREALQRFFDRLVEARLARFCEHEPDPRRRAVRCREVHNQAVRSHLAAKHGV